MNTVHSHALVDRLEDLHRHDDRGALAALRRSLDGEAASFARAAPIVAPFVPSGTPRSDEQAAYLVAGLFALHPSSGGARESFGRTFRRIAEQKDSKSLEARFVALLAASAEDLPTHLRHAVALARGEDVAVAWGQLLDDLLKWDHPDGFIQRRWASDYWASAATAPAPTASAEPEPA